MTTRGRFNLLINRRDAVLSSIALAALSGAWLRDRSVASSMRVPELNVSVPRLLIDAHCHVFNAHDIPMKPFIIETAVRESPDLKPWVGIASLLAWFINFWVDLTDNEISLIDYPSAHAPAADQVSEDAQFHTLVGASVERVALEAAAGTQAARALNLDPFTQTIMKYGQKRAPELFEVRTRSLSLPLNLSAVSMNYLLNQYGLEGLKHAETGTRLLDLDDKALAAGAIKLRAEDSALRGLTDSLVRDAHTQTTDVGSIMNLARIISRSRLRNIEVLDETLGVQAATPIVTRLYVPALVDFDCWYGDNTTSLAMWKQTSIMSKLSKKQRDKNRFANGYVAYDPLRAVLIDADVVEDLQSPLEVVSNAIETQGFLGAKLYPPMGFRAGFNSEIANEDFGPNVQQWIKQLKDKTGNQDFQLGPALDAALMKLYSYCLTNDVPIMAHCSNSQTSFSGSGERASPKYWLRLFEQSDPTSGMSLRNLRVNLGHFGSIWCQQYADAETTNPDDETERCHVAYQWPSTIVEAIAAKDGDSPRFPHLYFDLGDLGTITESTSSADWLRAFINGKPEDQRQAIMSHMIYGTDWMFLVLFGKTHVNYINSIQNFIADQPGASENIFHQNAARFLGLTKDGASAKRLRAFYADDPDRLQKFESLIV